MFFSNALGKSHTNGRKIKLKDLLENNKTALVNLSDCVVAQHISAQILHLFIYSKY